jgi:hypothetical protein
MKSFRNWQALTAIGLLTIIVIAYNACSETKFSRLDNTVSVGNPMATFEQTQQVSVVNNTNQVSMASFANPVSDGAFILCTIFYNSTTQSVSTMTDPMGNTYWGESGRISGVAGNLVGWTLEVWYSPQSIIGGANLSVTATFTAGFSGEKDMICNEYSGITFPNPTDNVSSSFGFGANISSASIPTSYSNELLVGVGVFDSSGATSGPGFTQRAILNNIVIEDKIVNTTGDYSATFSNPAMNWISNLTAVKGL